MFMSSSIEQSSTKSRGQPSDDGFILSPKFRIKVKKVMNKNGIIVHWGKLINCEVNGEKVFGEIDWFTRYLYMKRHTAAHLLDHCLFQVTGKTVVTTGYWLGESCYVGYEGKAPSTTLLKETFELGNRMIGRGLQVKTETVSRRELIKQNV